MQKRSKNSIAMACAAVICFVAISVCPAAETAGALARYYRQTPAWKPCEAGLLDATYESLLPLFGDRVRFATVKTPTDYANPDGGDIEVALLRVAAGDPSRRRGAIVINPGGPGEDGLAYSLLFGYLWSEANPATASGAAAFFKEVAQCYDLVGFSPRGTGSSTRLARASEQRLEPALVLSADRGAANISANMANAKAKAELLLADPLTRSIDSDSTARDMDIIRAVLGDEKLHYLGISYGTWLGTWYAGIFPDKVGGMVLIGNTDITARLNDTLLAQDMGMQRALDVVLAPYAAAHPEDFGLGSSPEEVRAAFRSIGGALLDATETLLHETIAQSVNAHITLLTFRAAIELDRLLAAAPGAGEEEIAARLDAVAWKLPEESALIAAGRAKELVAAYFKTLRGETDSLSMTPFDAVGWAVQCNDSGTSYDVDAWGLASSLNASIYPVFGGSNIENPCLFWNLPAIGRPSAEAIAGAGAFVMLQSEYDPYTVLEGALRTFSALPSASLIIVKGEFQHFLLLPYGNDAIDLPIAKYLLDGEPPQRLTIVAGNPLPMDRAAP